MNANMNSLAISVIDGQTHYNRNTHPAGLQASRLLAERYGEDEQCVLLPSGMAAITTAVTGILMDWKRSPLHVVIGNELYCDTPGAFKYLRSHFGRFELHPVDITDTSSLQNLFRQHKREALVLFVETCTNPSGDVMDFSIIPELRKRCRKFYFVADNTWITSSGFNPFEHGADLVAVSTSKYYSAAKSIGGAVIGHGKLFGRIARHARIMGQHVSPIHAQHILDSLPTLDARMSNTASLTLQVAEWMKEQDNVQAVKYVGLENHRSHEHAKKFFHQGPCVLSFLIGREQQIAEEWMVRNSNVIPYETSFGSPHSKFDPWPKRDAATNGTWCRLAIGYDESFDELTGRLGKALDSLAC